MTTRELDGVVYTQEEPTPLGCQDCAFWRSLDDCLKMPCNAGSEGLSHNIIWVKREQDTGDAGGSAAAD